LKKAVIVANGLFPTSKYVLGEVDNCDITISCDGAIANLLRNNISPDLLIGDFDSIDKYNLENLNCEIIHDPNQYTNDQTKAFNWAVEKGYSNIIIIGATGLREDHSIGNIFLLLSYLKRAHVKMLTDFGVFTPIENQTEFQSFSGQQVSLFSPFGAHVSTHNLKYSLQNAVLPELWNGTLNESMGEKFTIETDKPLLVYQTFKAK